HGRHNRSIEQPEEPRSAATPALAVVVLNWNRPALTLECLRSLDASTRPLLDILVVDNGSTDGSQSVIEASAPDVTVIQTGANLGYGGGNNVGIREAIRRGADLVWVLNNDTV